MRQAVKQKLQACISAYPGTSYSVNGKIAVIFDSDTSDLKYKFRLRRQFWWHRRLITNKATTERWVSADIGIGIYYFCIKRGDPQIRIQAKQERRTSEYRKREGGFRTTPPKPEKPHTIPILPLDANAITWYRFRQKHHSNHHITCQQTVPTTLPKKSS